MVIIEPSEEMYLYNRMRLSDYQFNQLFGSGSTGIPYSYRPDISRLVEFDDFTSFYAYRYGKGRLAEFEGRYFLRLVKEHNTVDDDFVLFSTSTVTNISPSLALDIIAGKDVTLKCGEEANFLVRKD